jgi:hypothetical protein
MKKRLRFRADCQNIEDHYFIDLGYGVRSRATGLNSGIKNLADCNAPYICRTAAYPTNVRSKFTFDHRGRKIGP